MNHTQCFVRALFTLGVVFVLLLLSINCFPIATAQEAKDGVDLQDQIRQLKEQLAKLQASASNGATPPPSPPPLAEGAPSANVTQNASTVSSLDDMVQRRRHDSSEQKRLATEAEAEAERLRLAEEERLRAEEEEERKRMEAEAAEAERLRLEEEQQRRAQEEEEAKRLQQQAEEARRLKELEAEKERLELEMQIHKLNEEKKRLEEEEKKRQAELEKSRHSEEQKRLEELEQIRRLEEEKRLLAEQEAERKRLEELEQIRLLEEQKRLLEKQQEEEKERQREAERKRLEELEKEKRRLEEEEAALREQQVREANAREAEKKQQLATIQELLTQLESDIKNIDERQADVQKSYFEQIQSQVTLLLDSLQDLHRAAAESIPLVQGLGDFKEAAAKSAALRSTLDRLGSAVDSALDIMDTVEGVLKNTSKEWKNTEHTRKQKEADVHKFVTLRQSIIAGAPVDMEEGNGVRDTQTTDIPSMTSAPEGAKNATAVSDESGEEEDSEAQPSTLRPEEPAAVTGEADKPLGTPVPSSTPSPVPHDAAENAEGEEDVVESEADAAAPSATNAPSTTAEPLPVEAPDASHYPASTEHPSPRKHNDDDVVAELEARVKSKGYNLSVYEKDPHEEVLFSFRSKLVLIGTSVLIATATAIFAWRGGCCADDEKDEGPGSPATKASPTQRAPAATSAPAAHASKQPTPQQASQPPSGLPQAGGQQRQQQQQQQQPPLPQQQQRTTPQALPPQAGRPKDAAGKGPPSPFPNLPHNDARPPPPHDNNAPRPPLGHSPEARSLFPTPPGHIPPVQPRPPQPQHTPQQQTPVPPQGTPDRSSLSPNQVAPPNRPRPQVAAAPSQEYDSGMEGELQNPFMQRWTKS